MEWCQGLGGDKQQHPLCSRSVVLPFDKHHKYNLKCLHEYAVNKMVTKLLTECRVCSGVRWGNGRHRHGWVNKVCIDRPFTLVLSFADAPTRTYSHTAGVGCYNVTQEENPHLKLCWLKNCRVGTHMYTWTVHTYTSTLRLHSKVCMHAYAATG